jgi:peptidoglycan hydrolase-like protein with peptidoglycan-binding domain
MLANHSLHLLFALAATAIALSLRVYANAALAATTGARAASKPAAARPASSPAQTDLPVDPTTSDRAPRAATTTAASGGLLSALGERPATALITPVGGGTSVAAPPSATVPSGRATTSGPSHPAPADCAAATALSAQVCALDTPSRPPQETRSTRTLSPRTPTATPPPARTAASTEPPVTGLPGVPPAATFPTAPDPVATGPVATDRVATDRVATGRVATWSLDTHGGSLVREEPRAEAFVASSPSFSSGLRLPMKSRTAAWWTVAVSVLALGFPTTALAAGTGSGQPTASASTRAGGAPSGGAHARLGRAVLALGSGYTSRGGSQLVRILQRALAARDYPPGQIDGLYGPLTRQAVLGFQAAHGLPADGVVGPRTWSALSDAVVILGPGAADQAGGEGTVRSLQRRLASAGDSPGPIDGHYGLRTDAAVRRFQRSHSLAVTGMAGPLTLALLAKPEQSRQSSSLAKRLAPAATRSNLRPRPMDSTAARAPRQRPASNARPVSPAAPHQPRPGSVPWIILLGALALALALLLLARLLIGSLRHPSSPSFPTKAQPVQRRVIAERQWASGSSVATPNDYPKPVQTAGAINPGQQFAGQGGTVEAPATYGRADQRDHGTAASNLGRLLEEQGGLAEAEAAYRRADEHGDADGAFHLAVLLAERGALDEAAAAYDRASGRGHNAAALELGILLVEHGALTEAEAAFTRADERGDAAAAFNLGVLLENRGALTEAMAAYHRAARRGDEELANMARTALLNTARKAQHISSRRATQAQIA